MRLDAAFFAIVLLAMSHYQPRQELRPWNSMPPRLTTSNSSVYIPMADHAKEILLLVPLTADDLRAETIQAQLAAIVDSSDDAIIGQTLDGTITSWNASAMRIFGYSASEVIGTSMTLHVPPELAEDWFGILRQIACGKHLKHFETIRIDNVGRRMVSVF